MSNERRVYERMPDGLTPLERRREANRPARRNEPAFRFTSGFLSVFRCF